MCAHRCLSGDGIARLHRLEDRFVLLQGRLGTWHLRSGARSESVKVRGPLASNDGECVLGWALDGHDILMRSLWEAAPVLRSGKLKPVLADWSLPSADIYAVFPTRSHLSAKTRALVDFLLMTFEPHRASDDGGW